MANNNKPTPQRLPRWYFGCVASAAATFFTHPLDLFKVNIQIQQGKLCIFPLAAKIVREQGVTALYSGISASVLRQMTYSLTRYGIYAVGKQNFETDTLVGKMTLAGFSGAIAGLAGTPADVVSVRMQNDVNLPAESRRNYKNAFDGLMRIYKSEGFRQLFSGATTCISRGFLMTVSQIACYDQIKTLLLSKPGFKDDFKTHLLASLGAGAIATTLTQPLDVLKTRAMSARPGEFTGLWDIIKFTARLGPKGFFKGSIPAFARLGPHTIITFVFLEQLTKNFGIEPKH